ncbi:MAG: hypothetical protein GXP49_00130 [Deltaproteobacteria bacterium]|nr:hypothetical protein [Deltaproteobacteria bacterium]
MRLDSLISITILFAVIYGPIGKAQEQQRKIPVSQNPEIKKIETKESDFEKLIEEANTSFRFLDFEGALQKLEQARVLPGITRIDLERILALKGMCLAPLGRDKEAEYAFKALLSLDPAYRLDPDLSPRYRTPFNRVLEQGIPRLVVEIHAPKFVTTGKNLVFSIDKVSDPAKLADHALIHYKNTGQGGYTSQVIDLPEPPGSTELNLKPAEWQQDDKGPIEWYGEIFDRHGILLMTKADPQYPLSIEVRKNKPKPKKAVALTEPARPTDNNSPEVLTANLEGNMKHKLEMPNPPSPGAENNKVRESSWYKKWWVWSLIGGSAVAVAATAAILATALKPTNGSRDLTLVFH